MESSQEKSLCAFCFDVIIAALKGQTPPPFPENVNGDEEYPLFVTWHKDGDL